MPSPVHRLLDAVQRLLARSDLGVRLAVAVRNQCRCIIKYHLAESPDVNQTGEVWLREAVAREGTTFVDVGANVGDWLAGIVEANAHESLRAIAFEPSSGAFARLAGRFAGDERVRLVNAAVGDETREVAFFEERDAGKGSTLVPGFAAVAGDPRTVGMHTLDDVLAEHGWEGADMLKIDAEGYDLRVLRGARRLLARHAFGVVQFEYNRSWQLAGDTLAAAYALLQAHGYEVYLLKREGLFRLNYRLYEEYFEYSNFVGVAPKAMPLLRPYVRGVI